MNRAAGRIIASGLILAVYAAGSAGLEADSGPTNRLLSDRMVEGPGWIIGTWRSYQLAYGDFGEWQGAARIELVATSPRELELYLISADGKRTPAGDNQGTLWDDKELSFGPIGSALIFRYRHSGDTLTIDLKARGVRIHAKLRRVRD